MTSSQRKAIQNIATTESQLECYRAMLKVAKQYGDEYGIEWATSQVREFENQLDYDMEMAIVAGVTPEDFESSITASV